MFESEVWKYHITDENIDSNFKFTSRQESFETVKKLEHPKTG